MHTRRAILHAAGASALAAAVPAFGAGRPLKILMFGGTNYVGPWLVNTALARGHDVALFNRGITNPHFFPKLEKLRGDRKQGPDVLSPLMQRKWDVVLDTWAEWPRCVEESVTALADRAGCYAFVSSISVYGNYRKIGLTEDDPRATLQERDPAGTDYGYRYNKSLAEAAVERTFGDRGLIVRGHAIIGYDYSRNPANNATYWPLRLRAGGDVLVPDDKTAVVQYTDVSDFCRFILDRAERKAGGVFNAVSKPFRFYDYIRTIHGLTGNRATLVPVDKEFLIANGGKPFDVVPQWVPMDHRGPGFYQISGAKAAAAGLRFRPVRETVKAILKTYAHKPENWIPEPGAAKGIPRELEQRLLAAWRAQSRTP